MKSYLKYILVLFFVMFSFYYTDKVIELSDYNNVILTSINDYASIVDKKCIEGQINENGIILGFGGLSVDKNKSYSNMKGIGFREDLVEYKTNKCIINKEDNLDKYIVASNNQTKSISLVIDIDSMKYYELMNEIAKKENVKLNYLIKDSDYDKINNKENLLLKTNTNNIKDFKKKTKYFYCVKYYNFDLLEYCKKEKISSINITNYYNSNLLSNVKSSLNSGQIYFVYEGQSNTDELLPTIKYIKSRGIKIVSIDELLS